MSILTVSIYSEIGQGRVDLGEEMNSAWRRVAGRRAAADSEEKQRSRRAPAARGGGSWARRRGALGGGAAWSLPGGAVELRQLAWRHDGSCVGGLDCGNDLNY